VDDPEIKACALGAGAETRGSTSAEFAAHLRDQSAAWTKLVAELELKAE